MLLARHIKLLCYLMVGTSFPSVVALVAAFCGGVFGAAIGGLLSFVLMGFLVLVGVMLALAGGGLEFLANVAWGSVFGPHVGLLGGAIAAAYAHRRGYYADGTQINIPLLKLRQIDVLLVGGVVGVIGFLLVTGLATIPILGDHLDAIAVAISLTMIVGRLAFGRVGLLGVRNSNAASMMQTGRVLWPGQPGFWVSYQHRWLAVIGQGMIVGAVAGVLTIVLGVLFPGAISVVHEFAFALSAISLVGLMFGATIPITHHITLPAATAVSLFLAPVTSLAGSALSPVLLVVAAATVGATAGITCELFARLWLNRGDTLIDPPTLTNAVLLTLLSISVEPRWQEFGNIPGWMIVTTIVSLVIGILLVTYAKSARCDSD